MDFASIKQITIPEGDVKQIAIGGDIVWKKRPNQSEVQYIEKTGTTESYFNTGFVPLWNDVIKSKYSTTVDDTKFLYMARQRSNRPCRGLYKLDTANKFRFAKTTGSSSGSYGDLFPDPAYTLGEWIEIVENGNRITITGEYGCAFDGVVGPTAAAGTIGGTLKIFSGDGAVAWGQAKFGYLKVYNNSQTTLKLDLVPYRIGTAPYLYDKVSGTFFAKIGTDDMVCGGDV